MTEATNQALDSEVSCSKNWEYSNEQSLTLIKQSSLSFLIVSKCSGFNLVKNSADFDSCGMAKGDGHDLFNLWHTA